MWDERSSETIQIGVKDVSARRYKALKKLIRSTGRS
jgi:hypothetical protein